MQKQTACSYEAKSMDAPGTAKQTLSLYQLQLQLCFYERYIIIFLANCTAIWETKDFHTPMAI